MSFITNLVNRCHTTPIYRSRLSLSLLLILFASFGLVRLDWRAQAQKQDGGQFIQLIHPPAAPPEPQRKADEPPVAAPLAALPAVQRNARGKTQPIMLLNTLTVTNTNDSGPGSLRQALADAAPGDTLNFNVTGTITLTSGQLVINHPLTINGPGARLLTVSGNHTSRVFRIAGSVAGTVTISGLTIANGSPASNTGSGGGGLLWVPTAGYNSTLNITHCAFTGNHAPQGGALVFAFGTLVMNQTTLSGNTASVIAGAYIQDSTATLTNCTISNNQAGSNSGGIAHIAAHSSSSTLTLINCTVANNSNQNVQFGGGALYTDSVINAPPAITQLKNTLVANNSPRNFYTLNSPNAAVNSLGHNLDSDGTSGFSNIVNGDWVGTLNAPLDAKLGPLANNGGATNTRALLCDSPALDAGTNSGAPATDQRGVARPINGAVDIGAYESGALCLGPLANGQAGVAYNQTITASGCNPPYSFALTQGNLPPGFTLNPTTGVVSGLATTTGTFNFTVQAQSAAGCFGTRSYTLVIGCPAIALNPPTLPNGSLGAAYNQTVTAAPAGSNYNFAVIAGALPPGLSLNGATGALTGTPTLAGTFGFVLRATGFGACGGNQSYSLTINGNACVPITLANLPNATLGTFYFAQAAASPSGSYSYSLSGTLPPGLSFVPASATLYGTPTAAGSYSFTITAANASGCVGSRTYSGFQVLTP